MKDQNQQDSCNQSRRKFINGSAAAAAGVTLAPGVQLMGVANARPLDEPIDSTKRWGILIDTAKCASDCNACVSACDSENGLDRGDEELSRPEQQASWIRKVTLKDKATGKETSLPVMCQHCESAPCVDVCPTGASFKREDGLALVDKHICIGCRYCMMACPYKARSFVHEELTKQAAHAPRGKGTVESCTMCVHRIDAGNSDPACVEACNADGHEAMIFGDMNDPNSELSKALRKFQTRQLREDLGLNTGVRYRNI